MDTVEDSQIQWEHTPMSTNVAAIAYDAANQHIWVRFKSGGVYKYEDCPPEIWHGFWKTQSKGGYVNAVLKAHPYTRVS